MRYAPPFLYYDIDFDPPIFTDVIYKAVHKFQLGIQMSVVFDYILLLLLTGN